MIAEDKSGASLKGILSITKKEVFIKNITKKEAKDNWLVRMIFRDASIDMSPLTPTYDNFSQILFTYLNFSLTKNKNIMNL